MQPATIKMMIRCGAYFLCSFVLLQAASLAAAAQGAPPSLQDQLLAQYTFAKVSQNANGPMVQEAGTVLVVQKDGLLGVPYVTLGACPAKYQDGALHKPSGFCAIMTANVARALKVGEKVYPWHLKVDLKNGKISIDLIACDSCVGADSPTIFKSQLVLEYAKGYLEKANVPDIEDAIAQVLTMDESNGGDQSQNQQSQDQQGGQQQNAEQAPQPEPQTIQIGQTREEVDAALGKPDTVANVGNKQICKYKDFKVTFVSGKVVDIQ